MADANVEGNATSNVIPIMVVDATAPVCIVKFDSCRFTETKFT